MKVLFLITKLDYSGGPKMLAWVANQFAKAQNEVTILSIYSDIVGQPLESNIRFLSLNKKQSSSRIKRNSIDMLDVVCKMHKCINDINPDVIVSFLYSVDVFYLLINKFCNRKMIVSMRVDPYYERGIAAKIRHMITKLADGFVFQTEGARDYYGNVVSKKSIVIPNPVTTRTLNYVDKVNDFANRDNIIVLPARLNIPQKRQDIMIEAFDIVYKLHPEMKLVLLGDGPDKDILNKMIAEKNMEGCIEMHKAVNSAEEYIYKCKIVALTSDYEGIPNALIEAMSLGINVVATDCSPGGARMLIKNGVNGYLVDKGDYEALAKRICELLDNANIANNFSYEAKKISDKYSEDVIARKWLEYVNRIVR